MFTPHPPKKGITSKHDISIRWQDDLETNSVITWYGAKTRAEYRLTRFGRHFPYLSPDLVGDLLVLIRVGESDFRAYILGLEEDISEIQAVLGVEVADRWAIFAAGLRSEESDDDCLNRKFRDFVERLDVFPPGVLFSDKTRAALNECVGAFDSLSFDSSLLHCMEAEYKLFRLAERRLCQSEIIGGFKDVDSFLASASSILNRRKARAGRSLENHVEQILLDARIPHKMRPLSIDGKPDIVVPSEEAYHDSNYPLNRLFIVGVKTTCKDRWRQVLNEGRRVEEKHLLTIQPSISTNQLNEMNKAGVRLIVPEKLHGNYPSQGRMKLLTVSAFVDGIKTALREKS